ncbi:hypothetical protein F503_08679 [Ophiostoma piceae UAMH 11346]|uniref:Uncharacterized protein n=1 Tax=Ophiostoma piceae (strain UAMH 11346) TaxID=1262450 RepID=S3CQZ2_OPHP1|nr:hypothetical protein F503_08679 [Ophiostoma piceae UAMH 11346]
MDSIECYQQTSPEGKLRFYLRTVHNLFRSYVAIAYCYQTAHIENPGLDLMQMRAAINSCSTVLWGMVERYPPGQGYRNVFGSLAKSILDPANDPGQHSSSQEQTSIFDSISSEIEITDLPCPPWTLYPGGLASLLETCIHSTVGLVLGNDLLKSQHSNDK